MATYLDSKRSQYPNRLVGGIWFGFASAKIRNSIPFRKRIQRRTQGDIYVLKWMIWKECAASWSPPDMNPGTLLLFRDARAFFAATHSTIKSSSRPLKAITWSSSRAFVGAICDRIHRDELSLPLEIHASKSR